MAKKKSLTNVPVSKISISELKRLLVLIVDNYPLVSFRYRLMGEMWQPNFMEVVKVTDKGVFLKDEITNVTLLVPELKLIMQFELDGTVHSYEPNFHYTVVTESQ